MAQRDIPRVTIRPVVGTVIPRVPTCTLTRADDVKLRGKAAK